MPKRRTLPTIAHLVAALSLGALGWFVSDLVRALMPPQTAFGWFNYLNAMLGGLCGWFIIGGRVGRGYTEAMASGLAGVLALTFWGFFLQSLHLMLKQSMQHRFAGPLKAVLGIFDNALHYATHLIDPLLVGVLLMGGMLSGLLAEAASRRWN